jgi:LysM repeat protein
VNGQEVSPENIHYPENAVNMDDQLGAADFNDYVNDGATMSDTMQYEIQPGDTLSEIAQANHTSVEHIMALNPQINDADMIYAGDGLIIPTNDNESNPYAEWSPESSAPTQMTEENPIIEYEPGEQGVDVEVEIDSSSTEFEPVEWTSFEDQPVEQYSEEELMQSSVDEYSMQPTYEDEFGQTNFDNYQSPDSYHSNDFDTDSYTTDFV